MFKVNKKNLILFSAIICVCLIVAGLILPLRQPVSASLKFPLGFFSLIGREIKAFIFFHRNMAENERLKEETGLLRQRLNSAEETNLENSRLKSLLSLKKESPFKVIVSRVIGRSPDNWSSLAMIDKGRHHGINKGYVVLGYSGLLGKVAEAGQSMSKVMLINDPNLSVSAIVQRSRQEGLVSGTLGNSLIMKYLPKEADVKVSDTVVTSGLTQAYPKGLLIGTIVGVGEEYSGLSRYAIIKPAADLSSAEEVMVIVK